QFLAQHAERLTVHPLPSYSPDYNPIEYLWKKTKKRATHNQYCKEFGWCPYNGCKPLCTAGYGSKHRHLCVQTGDVPDIGTRPEFALLTVSVEKALAHFATHPDTVLGLFGRYCEESGLELEQAA